MPSEGGRRGRRDNGLDAAAFVPLVDVDPRVGEHLLDVLASAGVPAFLEPSADIEPYTRTLSLPSPPTDRLWVDRAQRREAREIVDAETPHGTRPEPVPRDDEPSRGLGDLDEERAWRDIVSAWEAPAVEPTRPHRGPRTGPPPAPADPAADLPAAADTGPDDPAPDDLHRPGDGHGGGLVDDRDAADRDGRPRPDGDGGTGADRADPYGRHRTDDPRGPGADDRDPRRADRDRSGAPGSYRSGPDGTGADGAGADRAAGSRADRIDGPGGPGARGKRGKHSADRPTRRRWSRRARSGEITGTDLDRAAEARGRAEQDAADELWLDGPPSVDEGHFEPPPPPPVPRLSRQAVAGILVVLFGILLLAAPGTVGLDDRTGLTFGVAAILSGGALLVLRLRETRDDDGPDDGAVV